MTEEEAGANLSVEVAKLTAVTTELLALLKSDYPKRTEIERRYVTKLTQQKFLAKMVAVALVTVAGCYVTTIGAYSVCFVGAVGDNPSICRYVPGYKDRVARLDRNDRIDQQQDRRLKKLEGAK